MKEKFKTIKMQGSIRIKLSEKKGYWEADKWEVMNSIIKVCESFQRDGYTLTLRQLYYQLVSKDYIPNHDKVYKKLSSLKDELVYSGRVDWALFEDRGRTASKPFYEESVEEALRFTANEYKLDRQKGQKNHVEVWTEKDAISSILRNVTHPMGVILSVNKGYTSSTAIYTAYSRFIEKIGNGCSVTILYFGDHDPSGLDMIRDIRERLMFMFTNGERAYDEMDDLWDVDWSDEPVSINEMAHNWSTSIDEDGDEVYSDVVRYYLNDEDCISVWDDGQEYFDDVKAFFKHHFEIKQIGLTMSQIREFNPPPNPAKITDPRAKGYVEKFGEVSWEVDALRPQVMERIVKEAITREIDVEVYNNNLEQEKKDKKKILDIIKAL